MSRRRFLKTVALVGAGAMAGGLGVQRGAFVQQTPPRSATKRPIRILMGGYSPSSTGFSLALKRIGDRLKARFGNEVDIKYVYNVLDLGYREDDLNWMVEDAVLTLAYQSSGYFTNQVPDLGVADLPYLFPSVQAARAAIDGRLGQVLGARLEAGMNCRVLGYFEAGFSQLSNALRPVHAPADMKGMKIRVRPSKVQARTFELLGKRILLRIDCATLKSGTSRSWRGYGLEARPSMAPNSRVRRGSVTLHIIFIQSGYSGCERFNCRMSKEICSVDLDIVSLLEPK